jgi:hypothetical protein
MHPSDVLIQRNIHIANGQSETHDFNFELGGSVLQGRIIAPGLNPERMDLELVVSGEKGNHNYSTLGKADGTYKIEGIRAGKGKLSALAYPSAGNVIKSVFEIEIPENETVEQDIELEAMGSISGTLLGITPDRKGYVTLLKGAVDLSGMVTVDDIKAFLPEAEQNMVCQVSCDAAGLYLVEGLPLATYTLVATTVSNVDENDISKWRWSAAQMEFTEDNKAINQDFDLR